MIRRCAYCMAAIGEEDQICPVCGKEADAEAPFHHLPVGTMLHGRYYIGAALGQGGFGITYAGYDTERNCKVAVKEYYPNGFVTRSSVDCTVLISGATEEDKTFFEKGKKRFLDEANILAGFSGLEGVVNVHNCFADNNTVYIVMAFIEGVTLKDYLRTVKKLPVVDTLNLLIPVMSTLQQIHQKGLIHRDISPDNIMLTQEGTQLKVRLIDFGAARDVTSNGGRSLSVILKPGFAPIEQYGSHGKQGAWTDVYALCATIYTCITGAAPDAAPDRAREDCLKKPSERGAQIDPRLERVLMKGLALNDADRYRSVEALLKALLSDEEPEEQREKPVKQPPADPEDGAPEGEAREDAVAGRDRSAAGKSGGGRKKAVVAAVAAGAAVLAVAVILLVRFHANRPAADGNGSGGQSAAADPSETQWNGDGARLEPSPTEEAEPVAPPDASAAQVGECGSGSGDRVYWSLSPDGTLTVSGSGRMKDYGEEAEELPPWAADRDGIKEIVVKTGVTGLGRYAFSRHAALTSVSLPEGLSALPAHLFDGCVSLASADLPESLIRIGDGAFLHCAGLKSVSLPEGLGGIGASAFEGCAALTGVTLPEAVCGIGASAFAGCSALSSIAFPGGVTRIEAGTMKGCAALTGVTLREGIREIGASAFEGCSSLPSVKIPDSLKRIEDGAFRDCAALKLISVPESAIFLGSETFSGTAWYNDAPDGVIRLGSIIYEYKGTVPESQRMNIGSDAKAIASGAFRNQTGIVEAILPNAVTVIGDGAFEGCAGLLRITLPEGVTELRPHTFDGCAGMKSVAFPSDLTEIGSFAFRGCTQLTDVSLPDSVAAIRSGAFENCTGLKEISLPDTAAEVAEDAFRNTAWLNGQADGPVILGSLLYAYRGALPGDGTVTIPEGVKAVGERAFLGRTELTEAVLPDTLSLIGAEAFSGCTGLRSLRLPAGVTVIGSGAFQGCAGLTAVVLPVGVAEVGSRAFEGCASLKDVSVPEGAAAWGEEVFGNTAWYNEQPEGFLLLGSMLYGYKGEMPAGQRLTVGKEVKTVAGYAFAGQDGLVEAVIPEGVALLGGSAFAGCAQLQSLSLPESLTVIGQDLAPAGVIVFGKAGSYAQTWADENNRPFIAR